MFRRAANSLESAFHAFLIALCVLVAGGIIVALVVAAATYSRTEAVLKWI